MKRVFTGASGGRRGFSGGFGTGGITPVDFLGVVANQAAMLLLVGDKGDWCIRSDTNTVFVVINTPSSLIGNWQQLAYPVDPMKVLSDAGDPTAGYLDAKVENETLLVDPIRHRIMLASIAIPVLSLWDNSAALPVGPAVGDRYAALVTANGWFIGFIYQWSGAAWVLIKPSNNDGTVILTYAGVVGAWLYYQNEWTVLFCGLSNEIDRLPAKAVPTTADLLLIEDAANFFRKRKITIGDLPAVAPAAHAASHEADGADALTGYDKFYPCVIAAYDPIGGLPVAPAVADRYISGSTNFGWTLNHIYEWNGATWTDTTPVAKVNILVKGNTAVPHDVASIVGGAVYTYSGAAWQISKYSGTLLIDANDNKGSGFIADKLWSGDGGVVATDGLGHVTFGARNDGVTIDLIGVSPKSIAVKLLGITDAHVAVANKDGIAATPSMRTIGAGALQACAGNDARLSDARAPTVHAVNHNLGGVDIITTIPRYLFFADQLLTPNNADWAVNAAAGMSADSLNNALLNRQFDDTAEEGIGLFIEIPAGAVNMTFYFRSRAQTAPGAATTVLPRLYRRQIADNAVVGAWSALFAFAQIDIPTNTRYQYDSETVTLATLGLAAGNVVQLELTRNPADGLVGDWNLLEMRIYFG